MKHKILFIAPLPPPYNGHSLMSQSLLDIFKKDYDIKVIDLSKESMKEGSFSIKRIFQIIRVYFQVIFSQHKTKYIYLTISESIAGNLKDLLIYLFCSFNLKKMIIHLHGGSIHETVFKKSRIIRYLNFFFLKRFQAIIVLSESHKKIFAESMDLEKIKIVPNFIFPDFLISREYIDKKFNKTNPINLIFLGNMIYKKGYLHLCNAFLNLPDNLQKKFQLNFVGKFDSDQEKCNFLNLIKKSDRINYHGELIGEEKKKILHNAHVFILPSLFREGQPLAILEAYGSGCAVIATRQPGILDICKDNSNGFIIDVNSTKSIQDSLKRLIESRNELALIAMNNRNYAEANFSFQEFRKNILKVFHEN